MNDDRFGYEKLDPETLPRIVPRCGPCCGINPYLGTCNGAFEGICHLDNPDPTDAGVSTQDAAPDHLGRITDATLASLKSDAEFGLLFGPRIVLALLRHIERQENEIKAAEQRVWSPANGHWMVTRDGGITSYTCVGEIEDQDEAAIRVAIQRAEGEACKDLLALRGRIRGYSLADEFRAVADAIARHAAQEKKGNG